MKMKLGLLVKLGLACALTGSQFSVMAKPQALSTLDAQLVSYFKPYAPAAEVLIHRSNKNSTIATQPNGKVQAQKAGSNNKHLVEVCSENTASKTMETEGLDNKQMQTPKLP